MLLNPRMRLAKPGRADAQVVPGVPVEGLSRQDAADRRRDIVGESHGIAGERPELAEDRRLLNECGAKRHEHAVAKHLLAVHLLLVVPRVGLQAGDVVGLVDLHDTGRQLDAAVAAERVDAERRRRELCGSRSRRSG
jgi:hypothetical protein